MGMIADLFVKLGFKSDEFNKGIDGAKTKTDQFSSGLKKIGGAIAGAFAVEKIFEFSKSSVFAFDESAKSATRLLTALKGNKAEQEAIMDLAAQRQKTTLYEDDETINAMSLVAAFVKEESQLKSLLPLIQDFAAAKSIDMATAANVVGKSIGSNTNALSRYGIEIHGAAGSTERFDSAMKGLNERFGGQAQAIAGVGVGALTIIANKWGDIKEEIGRVIVESQTWKDLISNIKVGVDKDNFKSGLKDLEDILYVWNTKQLSIWQKLGVLIGKNGNADTDVAANKRITWAKEQDKRDNAEPNRQEGIAWLNKLNSNQSSIVEPKTISALELYNLRLQELKDKLTAAKDAAKMPPSASESYDSLGQAVDDATKKLEDFIKANRKVIREASPDSMKTKYFTPDVGKLSEKDYWEAINKKTDKTSKQSTPSLNNDGTIATSNKTEVPGLDMESIAGTIKGGEKLFDKLDSEYISPVEEFNMKLNETIKQGMTEAISTFAEGLGELFTGDMNIGEFGASLLGVVGSFMKQLGQLFITTAIGMIAFNAGLDSLNPFLMMGAGIALVAAGSAVSAFAKSGIGSHSSVSSSGSASGYSHYSGQSSASTALSGNVFFELHGNKLQGVLNNTNRRNQSYK